ncbi:MAG: hypothetical protein M1272_07885 [Firmicutes bacterium]|nr:hypothetical protein [Bacillota bacterium]
MPVSTYQENFPAPLGTMTLTILFWYDCPQIVWGKNDADQRFVGMLSEVTATMDEWLYTPVSESRLSAYLAGDISGRDVMVQCEAPWIFRVRRHYGDSAHIEIQTVAVSGLTEDDLPGLHSKLIPPKDDSPHE